MIKAYKYRIYPTGTQKILLAKTFGCVRFYWNNLVEVFNSYNKETNPHPEFKTQKELKSDYKWLGEVSATALQQKRRDFDELKKQLFSKNRKKKIGMPNFKKKSNNQSYRLTNQKFNVVGNKIRLEKIGFVKMVVDRMIPENSKFLFVTVSQNCAGQYFVSICTDQNIEHKSKTKKDIGIDLGLKEFAVMSDGQVINNLRFLRNNQSKLAKLQKCLSRKQKCSNRRKKCRIRVARLHNKISNQRNYFLHNESTKIVSAYDTIYLEDLNVEGMLKNHKLAGAISDVSWGEFRKMLEYKARWYGKSVITIGRFEPSSKVCSYCGWKKDDLTLKDRFFKCENCGLEIDRDLNAAKNIKAFGVANAIRVQSGRVADHVEVLKFNGDLL